MSGNDARDAVDVLGRLVAAQSPNPPGDERAVARVIEEESDALSLPAPKQHARDPARPNLILTIGEGSPALILAAHMDTVPPGDVSSWNSDPYEMSNVGGRLVGLGVADMKGGIAAMLVAAARWVREPTAPGSLTLVFSADEEAASSFGMQWLASEGLLRADAAVLTEPASAGDSSWEHFYVAQRGTCVAWLVARGEPGHSGAIMERERRASAPFARALAALVEAELFVGWAHPVDNTPVSVNVATVVEGGLIPWAHPETLRAAIEVRTIEGMTQDLVLKELRSVINDLGLTHRIEIEPAALPAGWFDPGRTVRDERLLGAARRAWRDVIGTAPPAPTVMTAGTDSSWLNAAGIDTLPAFGAGSFGVAHQPNEWLALHDLRQSVDLFEALIRYYLGSQGGNDSS
jgi:acetylornithine deacetylase/succinyl-diaminopimelate desuccinylase-like protein